MVKFIQKCEEMGKIVQSLKDENENCSVCEIKKMIEDEQKTFK